MTKFNFTNEFEFKHIFINDLSNKSAIYSFWYKNLNLPLYIGETENLKRRMKEYYSGGHNDDLDQYLNTQIRRKFIRVKYFFCPINELKKLEEDYIKFHNPSLNKEKKRK